MRIKCSLRCFAQCFCSHVYGIDSFVCTQNIRIIFSMHKNIVKIYIYFEWFGPIQFSISNLAEYSIGPATDKR